MKRYIFFNVLAVPAVSGIVISQNFSKISERLTGYEEVPAISTGANGTFTAGINGDSVSYQLSYHGTVRFREKGQFRSMRARVP